MRGSIIMTSVAAAAVLAACSGNGAKESAPAKTDSADAGAWNAEDACAILPKEKVAAIAKAPVLSATLDRVTKATSTTAGFSQCTYDFGGGVNIVFFARQSPIDDNSDTAMQSVHDTIAGIGGAKVEEVPGLGKRAFQTDAMHQLHVFQGGNRYFYFTSFKPPMGVPSRELMQALAKTVIS
ncbi:MULTISPECIES: DUF3558 domain-containing protein [Sphingomonas]|uniref:DUF3558 domain-containing protein n=1 Tax=Sphingomonas TaxID=13687 RepID=UPI00082D1069|nr:DUF3558 domain-containing protein [Sphingomonas sp. CCH10-B3]